MKWALVLTGVLVGVYLMLLLVLFVAQRSLIYPAPRDQIDVAVAGTKRVALRTDDGLILNAAYAPADRGKRTVVFFHGNGDGLIGANEATALIRRAGYGMLLVEYRGYGGNPASPNEQGLYRDGRAALDWLGARGVAGRRVVLMGNSLGTGIASQLASERPIGGLVLVSPFTSMAAAIAPHYPWVPVRWLLRDRYDTLAKVQGRQLAILVLHGGTDQLIASSQGADIAAAVQGSRLILVRDVGHELAYLPSTQHAIIQWLGRLPD